MSDKKLLKRNIFLFILSILLTVSASAEECQYTKEIVSGKQNLYLPYDLSGNPLDELIVQLNPTWNQPVRLINPNSQDLLIKIKINLNIKSVTWCDGYSHSLDHLREKTITIPGDSYIEIPVEKPVNNHYCTDFRWTKPYTVEYLKNNVVETKLVEIEQKSIVCDGKNNGEPCNSASDCGGGFCIENHCSSSEICPNNDCHCPESEIQCPENDRCVPRASITNDNYPKCGLSEECISGYIHEDGTCTRSPDQNKLMLFVSLILIFILAVSFYLYLSFRSEYGPIKQPYWEKYKSRYGKKIAVKGDYIIFVSTGEKLHRNIFKSHYEIPKGNVIHHIDANTFNNNIWNLIALPRKVHTFKIKHARIKEGNWDSGIEELKRIGLSEDDFHSEIKKRLPKFIRGGPIF